MDKWGVQWSSVATYSENNNFIYTKIIGKDLNRTLETLFEDIVFIAYFPLLDSLCKKVYVHENPTTVSCDCNLGISWGIVLFRLIGDFRYKSSWIEVLRKSTRKQTHSPSKSNVGERGIQLMLPLEPSNCFSRVN